MGALKERDVVDRFINQHFHLFSAIVGEEKLRIYALEFPVKTNDGLKKADVVIEVDDENSMYNRKMMVLEFKKDFIDNGAASQVRRYSDTVGLQLYRKKKITSFIVGSDFSKHEINMCRELNVFPLQYDVKSGSMRIR
jgi:hypothetical protein